MKKPTKKPRRIRPTMAAEETEWDRAQKQLERANVERELRARGVNVGDSPNTQPRWPSDIAVAAAKAFGEWRPCPGMSARLAAATMAERETRIALDVVRERGRNERAPREEAWLVARAALNRAREEIAASRRSARLSPCPRVDARNARIFRELFGDDAVEEPRRCLPWGSRPGDSRSRTRSEYVSERRREREALRQARLETQRLGF